VRKTTKYRRFELVVEEDNTAVQQAERLLAQTPGKTVDMLSVMYYLFVREQQAGILRSLYAEERTNHATSHFLFRKLRLSAYKQDENRLEAGTLPYVIIFKTLCSCWVTGLLTKPVTMNRYEEKVCGKC
jgi:hypothetical protein